MNYWHKTIFIFCYFCLKSCNDLCIFMLCRTKLNLMQILIIIVVVICASLANGYFFSEMGFPENFVFMFAVSLVCGVALYYHRRITKNWKKPLDPWSGPTHFPIFYIMTVVAYFFFAVNCLKFEEHKFAVAAFLTCAVASNIACIRERDYTWKAAESAAFFY